ncbi:MAG: hypothetical protein L7S48_03625 [Candidatus Poseidonia sp.]|nr:hypothetical protein [Poseidonia sp.]
MVMVVTPNELIRYTRAIQAILTGYSGYIKGKRIETDQQVREEIIRASTRCRQHIQNIHDAGLRQSNMPLAKECKSCIHELDALIEDVDKSSSGARGAFFTSQKKLTNKDLKTLIRHDKEVIEMVTEAVRLSNDAERAMQQGSEETVPALMQCQQKVSSCRGFYSERLVHLGDI